MQSQLNAKIQKNDAVLKETEEAEPIDESLDIQMGDDMIDWDYANKVKDEFLAIYPGIVNEIRPIYFTKMLEIMNKSNKTFKINTIIEIARSSFLQSLNEQFDKVWVAERLAVNLALVNMLKKTCMLEKKPKEKWRPTGKTVAEQTLPIRCKMLEAKKNYILRQWELQKVQLQSLVAEVEKNRAHVNQLIKRREELLFKMDVSSEKFEDMKKRFREIKSSIYNSLRQ